MFDGCESLPVTMQNPTYHIGISFESKRARVKTSDDVFSFSCAQSSQREHDPKVPRGKARTTRRMHRFDCEGWLHIAVSKMSSLMDIKLRHQEIHPAYLDVDLPEVWKEYIEANAKVQTPGQVRKVLTP